MIDRYKGSRSDYWNTPKELYKEILELGYIDYNPENSYIVPFNRNVNLYRNDKVFINPPFSILNKSEWLETVKGRLKYNDSQPAPFPSLWVYSQRD